MRHAVLAIVIVFLAGCRNNDQPIENFPPETQLQVDTIIRSSDLRLGTNVQLHWYGTDRDGFNAGYNVKQWKSPYAHRAECKRARTQNIK